MTDKHALYTGVSRAAWGCVFLYLNINIGPVNLLPEFVAYVLFLSAIRHLEGEVRELGLLRPFGWALAVWNLLTWGGAVFGLDPGGRLPAVKLVLNLMEIWFFFQLFTDLAELAGRFEPEPALSRRILRLRTVQILLLMLLALPWEPIVNRWVFGEVLLGILALAGVAVCLAVMASLFALRRLIRENDDYPDRTLNIEEK